MRLEIGGVVAAEGASAVPGGDAFDTVAAFARVIGNHCGGLKAGDALITGSLEGLFYGKPGDAILGTIDGVGTVSAQLRLNWPDLPLSSNNLRALDWWHPGTWRRGRLLEYGNR